MQEARGEGSVPFPIYTIHGNSERGPQWRCSDAIPSNVDYPVSLISDNGPPPLNHKKAIACKGSTGTVCRIAESEESHSTPTPTRDLRKDVKAKGYL